MNVYLVRKTVITPNDRYSEAVVFAESEEQAMNMKPRLKCSGPYDRWEDDVVIEEIGICTNKYAYSSIQMVSLNFSFTKLKGEL